jgi:hypothetical protein
MISLMGKDSWASFIFWRLVMVYVGIACLV